MKRSILFLLAITLVTVCSAQINPWQGIYDVDSCNFEMCSPLLNLYTDSSDIWQIGEPAKTNFQEAYSPTLAIVTDTVSPYPVSSNSYFEVAIQNWYYAGMIVSFWHKFDTDTLQDGGYIEVSYDDENVWTNVLYDDTAHWMVELNTENFYTDQDSLSNGHLGFSGNSNGWRYSRMQWTWVLPLKMNPPDSLRLRFHFVSDSIENNKDGWMIDNFLVSYANLGGSIDEVNYAQQNMSLFPNPAKDLVQVNLTELQGEQLNYSIYSSLGQLVKQNQIPTISKFTIEMNDLVEGIYILRVDNGEKLLGTGRIFKK